MAWLEERATSGTRSGPTRSGRTHRPGGRPVRPRPGRSVPGTGPTPAFGRAAAARRRDRPGRRGRGGQRGAGAGAVAGGFRRGRHGQHRVGGWDHRGRARRRELGRCAVRPRHRRAARRFLTCSRPIPGCRRPHRAEVTAAARASPVRPARTNTTIGVVATDAVLSKREAQKLAGAAHDGLARAVRPAHLLTDGDTFFALATGHPRRTGGHIAGAEPSGPGAGAERRRWPQVRTSSPGPSSGPSSPRPASRRSCRDLYRSLLVDRPRLTCPRELRGVRRQADGR